MTNTIVTTEAEAVNTADTLEVAYIAAVEARTAAFNASMARPNSLQAVRDLKAALEAETVAYDAWKAAEKVLYAMWRAADDASEEARLQAMCEAYETLEHDYDGFSDHHYQLTPAGEFYLDHHYATHSNA